MRRFIILFITIFMGTLLFAQNAPNAPYVYNVTGSQRTDGTKIVDIYYNVLEPDGDTLLVSLRVSADDGATFDITPSDSLLSGDIGEGVLSGNNKHIIWQAGEEDSLTFEGNAYRFQVIADDNSFQNFVFVEGGTFQMGDRLDNMTYALPIHSVTLSSFYLAETEVTQADYTAIMGSNPAHDYGVGDNYPVYNVTWYDAITYCNKKSINENLTPCYSVSGDTNPDNWGSSFTPDVNWNANGYRLPTEAEWEYAARGGIHESDNYRYSGCNTESELPDYAWYHSNSTYTSHEVGTKLPNQLGLYDMTGNLFDWCWDRYGSYSSNSQTNPHGANSGNLRILRGGSWYSYATYCSVAYRNRAYPYNSHYDYGFRILRALP